MGRNGLGSASAPRICLDDNNLAPDIVGMGRSRPTYRQSLDNFRTEFEPFRRALRRENQPAFDRLYEHARLHTPSAKIANRGDLETFILLSMALGLQRDILELREKLE